MKTLTLQDINPFLPYGLKGSYKDLPKGNLFEVSGYKIEDNEGLEEIYIIGNCGPYGGQRGFIETFKPILYHISWLTKEIMLPGYADKVIPLALLAEEIFGGIWIGSENYFAIKNPNSNCVAISKSTEQLKVYFEPFCVVVSALGEDGEMYSPPFDMNKVCRFLGKYHFNFNGISDDLVEYVTETFNPYIK